MKNKMLNNKIKYLTSFMVSILMVFALMVPAFAAKSYTVSFKAGSKGIYTDGSTSKNEMVAANGDLKVSPDTLVADLQIEEGYYFNGWNYTVKQTNVSKSASYVAQYKRIVNEAVYRVSYVDNFGNELATQKVVTSNIGIVVAENALNIEGYAVDQLTKTAKVEKDGTQIVFTYVSTESGEVQTITQNEVVVVAGGAIDAGANTPTVEGGTGNDAGGTGGIGTEEVPEDETPLAGKEKTSSGISSESLIFGGIVLAVVVIAGTIYVVKTKKKAE